MMWFAETAPLLQQMIRNGCVNTGIPESTVGEVANADLVADYLEGSGVDLETVQPAIGRRSVVARLEGSDPSCPTLAMVGHLDVVPASDMGWTRDPFGGELVGDEVWGRGAVDMLGSTAAMAVVMRRLAAGKRPRGTVILAAVADEEAGGRLGAEYLVEHRPDLVNCDGMVTESGGARLGGFPGRVVVTVGEKGMKWVRIRVHGDTGHGSSPYGVRNAVVMAARIVTYMTEMGTSAVLGELWADYVRACGLGPELSERLLDPARLDDAIRDWPEQRSYAHACTHTTASANVITGGCKVNTIPGYCEIQVDIRTLPGDIFDVHSILQEALGVEVDSVEVETLSLAEPSRSPVDGPLYCAITETIGALARGATPLPVLATGGTDAKHFRRLGATAYGFGLLSHRISIQEFRRRFHGVDERIDLDSLRLTTRALFGLCERYSFTSVT